MKKILLATAAIAAMSFSANANLYITGDFEASYWTAENAIEMPMDGGNYSMTIPSVSAIKISTEKGDWDKFNGNARQLASNPEAPGTFDLIYGTENINMPWAGEWTIVVNSDISKITLSTTTPKPEGYAAVYLRGAMNEWGTEWEMTTTNGIVYTLKNKVVGLNEFKVADANWSKINYGVAYGVKALVNDDTTLQPGGSNIVIDYEDGETDIELDFTFVLDNPATLSIVPSPSAVEAVKADNAAPVYYNLQGVRVANPLPGNVYIEVRGPKATKTLL